MRRRLQATRVASAALLALLLASAGVSQGRHEQFVAASIISPPRGKPPAGADDLAHGRFAGVAGVLAVGQQALIGVQPVLRQCRAVGSQPGAGVTHHVFQAAGDERDAPLAAVQDVGFAAAWNGS